MKNTTKTTYSKKNVNLSAIGARSFMIPPAKQHVKTDGTQTYFVSHPTIIGGKVHTLSITPQRAKELRRDGCKVVKYNQRLHPVPNEARPNVSGATNAGYSL